MEKKMNADRFSDDATPTPGLTRRDLLQRVGWVMAVSGIPVEVTVAGQRGDRAAAESAAPHPVSDVMTRLSTYMSEARERPLPEQVLEQAKWHMLDTFAAMVSGSELPPGRAAIAFARAYGGKKVATVVADTIVCGPSKPRWRTACWRMRTRPTIRGQVAGILAAASFRRRWRLASSSGSAARTSCAPSRSATTSARAC